MLGYLSYIQHISEIVVGVYHCLKALDLGLQGLNLKGVLLKLSFMLKFDLLTINFFLCQRRTEQVDLLVLDYRHFSNGVIECALFFEFPFLQLVEQTKMLLLQSTIVLFQFLNFVCELLNACNVLILAITLRLDK